MRSINMPALSRKIGCRMNIKKLPIAIASLLFSIAVSSCGSENREEADRAYRALKDLQAKTEAGINYQDYSRALGTTLGVVSVYLERGKKGSELYDALAKAMENYKEAKTPWDMKIARLDEGGMAQYMPDSDDPAEELVRQLEGEPGVDNSADEVVVMVGRVEVPVRFLDRDGESTWDLDAVTQVHWALADIELTKAAEKLK